MNSVSHVGLTVNSLEKVANWYIDALGFEIVQRFSKPSWECEVAFLRLGSFQVELFCFGNSKSDHLSGSEKPKVPDLLRSSGSAFIALSVPRLDECLAHLRDIGTPVVSEPTRGMTGHIYAFVQDPNGTLLELFEPLLGTGGER